MPLVFQSEGKSTHVKYDPIKKVLGDVVRENVFLRKLFYKLLGTDVSREWHVKRELRAILNREKRPVQIYDAGCGFGQYSYYCATHFPSSKIYAVDVKEDQIADCTRFFHRAGLTNASFAIEDLTQVQHDNCFDLAVSVDVMEHIPDDVGVFRNLHRSLRSGGTLLVNTPSDLGGSDAHGPEDESFIEEHARNGYGVGGNQNETGIGGFSRRLSEIRLWSMGIDCMASRHQISNAHAESQQGVLHHPSLLLPHHASIYPPSYVS